MTGNTLELSFDDVGIPRIRQALNCERWRGTLQVNGGDGSVPGIRRLITDYGGQDALAPQVGGSGREKATQRCIGLCQTCSASCFSRTRSSPALLAKSTDVSELPIPRFEREAELVASLIKVSRFFFVCEILFVFVFVSVLCCQPIVSSCLW